MFPKETGYTRENSNQCCRKTHTYVAVSGLSTLKISFSLRENLILNLTEAQSELESQLQILRAFEQRLSE